MAEKEVSVSEDSSRKRILTEKGLDYKIQVLKGKFRSAVSSWNSTATDLSVLLSDSEDCKRIRTCRDELQICYREIYCIQEQVAKLDESNESVTEILNKFDKIQNDHRTLMSQISEEIRSNKSERSTRQSRRSHSNSKLSSLTKMDYISESAKLRAKLKFHDAETKMKSELEKLETLKQLEIVQAQAEQADIMDHSPLFVQSELDRLPQADMKSYVKDFLEKHSIDMEPVTCPPAASADYFSGTQIRNPIQTQVSNAPISNLNPSCNEFIPHRAISEPNQALIDLTKTLADQVSLNRLPTPEPSVFQGDPLQYQSWKFAFKTLIDSRNIPPCERIHYLRRYLGDSVKQIVESCLLVPSDRSYEDARKLLDERFGDPFVIASAFRDRLEAWPKIQSKDSSSLRKFSDFLRQCLAAMPDIPELSILNDCRENRRILLKLPDWLVLRWNRVASTYREIHKHFPSFEYFVDFVVKEARVASDPITSIQSLKAKEQEKHGKFQNKSKSVQSRSFQSCIENSSEANVNTNTSSVEMNICILCNGTHVLDDCKSFHEKSIADRKEFVRNNNLCFACLSSGHFAKSCRQRKTCKICSRSHPTSLHGDSKKAKRDSSSNKCSGLDKSKENSEIRTGVTFLNNSGAESKCSAIVPVYLSYSENTENERLVYALLDSQSDTTFILQDTCKELGLSGTCINLSLSTMYAENMVISSEKIHGLCVRGFNCHERIPLPPVYTRDIMPANRSHIPSPAVARTWPHLEKIAPNLMDIDSCEIGLLIGYNCPQALMPREIIPPPIENKMGPYGQRTDLGWSIVGIVKQGCIPGDSIGLSHRVVACEVPAEVACYENNCVPSVLFSCRSSVKEIVSADVLRIMERDFCDNSQTCVTLSQEDKQFLNILEKGICLKDGHYEMPLPFRTPMPMLPNNRIVALRRLRGIQNRLKNDKKLCKHYSQFMQDLLIKGHAEKIKNDIQADKTVWYIPHHGVYHTHKPDKIRVVFDCSSTFQGHSLNQHLLQGPDLTNKLFGVLCRFRKEPVALMCDIEQMFYQFKVSPSHRDYLRFLWWDSDDFSKEPVDFRMTVHLFGASSSPGCANFGLKRVASDNQDVFGLAAKEFIHKDFYVDDGVKSVATVREAIDLIENTKSMCSKGGLHLHKFVSNRKEVLQSLRPEERSKDLVNIDLVKDILPIERTLGILWCIESDTFQFKIVLKDRPLTRRGVLSSVGCLYDPLGFIAPVVLLGKQILQAMCAEKADWDDPLPEYLQSKWQKWRKDLECLSYLKINRCVKPMDFGDLAKVELHHFSDASSVGYGHCSYIRLVNKKNHVHCSLLMGKSRVIPLKPVTVPRLELVSATSVAKHGHTLQNELGYENIENIYWTDSKIVLGYISNDARRFHVFVANRVQQIKEFTKPSDWYHIGSKENPADIASRGVSAKDLVENHIWFNGPDFLWKQNLPAQEIIDISIPENDPEKKLSFLANKCTKQNFPSMLERLERFSNWRMAKRAVALILRFMAILRQRSVSKVDGNLHSVAIQPLNVEELEKAKLAIVKIVQGSEFSEEIQQLRSFEISKCPVGRQDVVHRHKFLKSSSRLRRLDPFLDSTGILRVGGRIRYANVDISLKHPIILPKHGHVTQLIGRHFHEKTRHQGRGMTINEIRQNGYWILGCSGVVSSLVSKCQVCRKFRAKSQCQKMSDLPSDRLTSTPPFTYCAVDLFGPFLIKDGRRECKRYGVLFTCMGCRAVHVESVNSLESDSFINCLRRFIALRGPIRQLRSDRGTNFVGSDRELYQSLSHLDNSKIRQFCLEQNCDFFPFKMNVPNASHMGGVWERQIRSVRSVLNNLLNTHGSQLNDECLRTFLHESAAIVNSRPLTVENIHDPLSCTPLTPNQLLTLKTKVVLPPPGNFQREDLYSRRYWKRTQYLVEQFWSRWKLEFLQNIQVRNKWHFNKRNFKIGDVVLVKDENIPRNQWKLARVSEVTVDEDGLVRKVKIVMSSSDLDKNGKRSSPVSVLERPIHKLVLVHETEEDPIKEPL